MKKATTMLLCGFLLLAVFAATPPVQRTDAGPPVSKDVGVKTEKKTLINLHSGDHFTCHQEASVSVSYKSSPQYGELQMPTVSRVISNTNPGRKERRWRSCDADNNFKKLIQKETGHYLFNYGLRSLWVTNYNS